MWDVKQNTSKISSVVLVPMTARGLGYSNETGDYSFTMEELVNDLFL